MPSIRLRPGRCRWRTMPPAPTMPMRRGLTAEPDEEEELERDSWATGMAKVGARIRAKLRGLWDKAKRTFEPNLKVKRLWVPELNRFVKVKLTARALKTVAKNGAFRTLRKAGVV